MSKEKALSLSTLIFLSFFSFAATTSAAADSGTLQTIADAFTNSIVNSLITLAIAVAAAVFFYGGFRYIFGIRNGEEKALKDGNKFLLWGGITLFVMVSMWGIIAVVQGTFGFSSMNITLPNASLNFIGSGTSGAGGAAGSGSGSGTMGAPATTFTPAQIAAQLQVNNIVSAIDQASKEIAAKGGNPNQIGTNPAECIAKGASQATCNAAFPPALTGPTGNTAFDNCTAGGNGVAECRRMTEGSTGAWNPGEVPGSTASACDGKTSESQRDSCYAGITTRTDTSHCDSIIIDNQRDACYSGGGIVPAGTEVRGDDYNNTSPGSSEGDDYGTPTDYGSDDWQTTGNGYDTNTGDDYGTSVDYGSDDWQTTGNGYDAGGEYGGYDDGGSVPGLPIED